MERYSLPLRIQSECGKMLTRLTSNMDTFHAALWLTGFIFFNELKIENSSILVGEK